MSAFDENPFADPSVQQAAATNQGQSAASLDNYDPFSQQKTTTTPSGGGGGDGVSGPAVMSPTQETDPPPAYNRLAQQTVTAADFQRRQEELERKAAELARREEELKASPYNARANNWPPLPGFMPCQPCFYQDINVDIPVEFQETVKRLYYLWLLHTALYLANLFGTLCSLFGGLDDGSAFGVSLAYVIFFVPLSFLCWFRPAYKAFKADSSMWFMTFFLIFFAQFCFSVLMALGIRQMGACGLIVAISTFTGGTKSGGATGGDYFIGFILIVITTGWIIAALADFFILTKIHGYYRATGASISKAQAEFTTNVFSNEAVRNAAASAAAAGVRQGFQVVFDTVVTTYELKFVNKGYDNMKAKHASQQDNSMPIKASVLFEMFPFSILYNDKMEVTCLGIALRQIIPRIIGEGLSSWWELVKPLVEFRWEVIMTRLNSMFELATQEEIDKLNQSGNASSSSGFDDVDNLLDEEIDKTLHIKGQMVWMKDWDQMIFLACPMMPDLNNLIWSGLFINDLSMHDYSRDIMLATTQEKIQMKMTLLTMEKKSAKLDEQQKKLAEVMKKSDDIIAQMLPKTVAEDLAKGKSNNEICKSYDCVTMLQSDIVTFTIICSKLKPTQVVQLLNNMYTLFDFLCDQNAVYKVETIGDAYLIVAGCPNKAANHALKICDMAFDMMDGIKILKVPGSGDDIHMRIGIHSGPVVAGVVGLKMPRYCLFGTNVGLTEKVEAMSKADQIHITEKTIEHLSSQYKLEERKEEGLSMRLGGLKSFFLTSKDNRKPLQEAIIKALLPTKEEAPKVGKKEKEKKDDKKDAGKKADDSKPAAKAEPAKPAAKAEPAKPSEAAPAPAKAEAAPAPPPAAAAPPPPPPAASAPPPAAAPAAPAAATVEDTEPEPEVKADTDDAVEAGEEGEAGEETDALDVETVNQQQCCGGLKKSAVCSVL